MEHPAPNRISLSLHLDCEMGRPYARQDLADLDKLNAEDYTQTDTRGVVVTHADYLEYVR